MSRLMLDKQKRENLEKGKRQLTKAKDEEKRKTDRN
jgi:hypothetical protein